MWWIVGIAAIGLLSALLLRRPRKSALPTGVSVRYTNHARERMAERGVTAQGHVVTGEPVDEICRLATALGADLIVVGHARHAFFMSRWWKGSVGATLIEDAPCSVLIAIAR